MAKNTSTKEQYAKNLQNFAPTQTDDINDLIISDTESKKKNMVDSYEISEIKRQASIEKSKERARIAYLQRQREEAKNNNVNFDTTQQEPINSRTKHQQEKIAAAEKRVELLNRIDASAPIDKHIDEIVECEYIEAPQSIVDQGLPQFPKKRRSLSEQYPTREILEAAEPQKPNVKLVTATQMPDANELKQLRSTSRKEIARLMDSLNINLDVQLSKADTFNLISCLLTCNETQLAALYKNPKIPLAIKIIIKRIQDDAKVGDIATVERLWDRIFGKQPMSQTENTNSNEQLIPRTPISREAYLILRDTFIQ